MPRMRVPRPCWVSLVSAALTVLLLSASCVTSQPQQAIAFTSYRDGNGEIYRMTGSGEAQTRLTSDPAEDRMPRWSPDGRTILFVSARDGNTELYSMRADGGEPTNLTRNAANDDSPAWSPDGSRIVFVRWTAAGKWDVWVMDASGGEQRQLTRSPEDDMCPAWSPDSQWLVYMGSQGGRFQIFRVRADGEMLTQLTREAPGAVDPDWSADGDWIAFMSDRTGDCEIYKMRPDGSAQTRLTHAQGIDRYPLWSPDGVEIAFVSQRDGNKEIYSVRADGSGEKNLTNNPKDDWDQEWSANSEYLLFVTARDGADEVYAMDRYGARVQAISRHEAGDAIPHLGPPLAAPPPPVAQPQPGRGIIAFSRGGQVFLINPDGSNMRRVEGIGNLQGLWAGPRLSPDGQAVAYARVTDPARNRFLTDLFVYYLPSGPEVPVTRMPSAYGNISWSPDGRRLLAWSNRDPNNDFSLATHWWFPLDGSPRAKLPALYPGDRYFSSQYADLSRDGQWVAYLHGSQASAARLDGSRAHRLYDHSQSPWDYGDRTLCFSPDGTQIAFLRFPGKDPDAWGPSPLRDGTKTALKHELCLVPATGGVPRIVAQGLEITFGCTVSWSPDGSEILMVCGLVSDPNDRYALHIVNLETRRVRKLVTEPVNQPIVSADWR
ncbi:hypothetical protein LLH23_01850 [bacterium]|nr:hypothetical protein [bacterium]